MSKFRATQINSLPPGKHLDGAGLYIKVVEGKKSTTRTYFFRYMRGGKDTMISIGNAKYIDLASARQQAANYNAMLAAGKDPREEQKAEKAAEQRTIKTLRDAVYDAVKAKSLELKNDYRVKRWTSEIDKHAASIMDTPIEKITREDLHEVLAAVWYDKQETAKKLFNKLRYVFEIQDAAGLNVDPLVFIRIKKTLGTNKKPAVHHPSLEYSLVPAFYKQVRSDVDANKKRQTSTYYAIMFTMLTGLRVGSVRNLRFDMIKRHEDIDYIEIPVEHAKGRLGQTNVTRLPLTRQMKSLIDEMRHHENNKLNKLNLVFPSRVFTVLDSAALAKTLSRSYAGDIKFTNHGMRTSMSLYLVYEAKAPDARIVKMLQHEPYSLSDRAYLRKHINEIREQLPFYQSWNDFLSE